MFTWLIRIHRFLAHRALYPLLLSTLLAGGLFAGRVYLSRDLTYIFLVWNLFLAWLPYLGSLWASHMHQLYPRRWWPLLIPGLWWLAFFPNAPYLLTDFIHLRARAPIPLWYDLGLLATFAWTGLFLGLFSLRIMQTLVRDFVGQVTSWLFVISAIGLGGLGVYLGRFLRWNSWDLILHPEDILADVAIRLVNPFSNLQTIGVTLLFAALLLVCYLTLVAGPSPEKS